MLLSSCPRCHDSIRIPENAQQESVVRCPRCREQFSLKEIWSTLPPEAEIVSGPGALGYTVAAGSSGGYALADRPPSDFQFKESGRLQSDTPPMAKLDSSRSPRRPKKAEPNVVAESAKIVLGGAAGLLIALLAILWIGKRDVFKIVPKLPVQAYFLVPEDLRTTAMKTYAAEETAEEGEAEAEPAVEENPVREVPVETIRKNNDETAQTDEAESSDSLASAFQDSLQRNERPARPNRASRQPEPEPMAETADEMPAVAEVPEQPAEPMAEPAEEAAEEADPEPTEPTPIDAELLEKINAASKELGPIGAEIPEEMPSADQPVTPVGDIDLSPVEDTQN